MEKLYLIKINNLYGYINKSGDIKIKPMYKNALDFNDGLAKVITIDGRGYVIDSNNNIIFEVKKECYLRFSHGLAGFRNENNKCGFMNKKGVVIIEPKYDSILRGFNKEGFAVVKKDRKCGTINKMGKEIIGLQYKSIGKYSEGTMSVTNMEDKCGLIDKDGNIIIDFKYKFVSELSEGLCVFKKNEKYGVMDKNQNIIIDEKYHSLWGYHNGLSAFSLGPDAPMGFVDRNGVVVIKDKYQGVSNFYDELAVFTNNDLSGYINKSGEEIVKNIFASAHDFIDGLARVTTIEGEWGYINNEGKWIYKPKNI